MTRPSSYAPESPDYLIINNEITSNDIGIWVDTPPIPPMAEKSYREINIPGREETLGITEETYKDVNLPVKAYIFRKDYDITNVYAWLKDAKTLRFNESDYYYRVKRVLPPTLNYQGEGKTMVTLNFVVSPFRYLVDDPVVEETALSFTIQNNGNIYSRPVYKIYGHDYVKLTIDGDSIEVTGIQDYVIIDAERLMIYHGDVSQNPVMPEDILSSIGSIPLLPVGENTVTIESNVSSTFTKIEIMRNQRVV